MSTNAKPSNSNTIETRHNAGAEVRLDGGGDGKPTKITGYAAVYGAMSEPMTTSRGTQFRERIRPGAFGELKDADVLARYNHELILGRTKSGTLKLTVDERGLKYEITPPETAPAQHAVESIRRGDVDGSSFAFKTLKDEWRMVDGTPVRELVSVSLVDVGPVDRPAYAATSDTGNSVSLRSLGTDEAAVDAAIEELRKAPEQPAAGGGTEKRYYHDPAASPVSQAMRDAIDRARHAADGATAVLDRIADRQRVTLTPQELQAAKDCKEELKWAANRIAEAASQCAGLLPGTGGEQRQQGPTPLLTARQARRAALI